jgi:hypothetical protein
MAEILMLELSAFSEFLVTALRVGSDLQADCTSSNHRTPTHK